MDPARPSWSETLSESEIEIGFPVPSELAAAVRSAGPTVLTTVSTTVCEKAKK